MVSRVPENAVVHVAWPGVKVLDASQYGSPEEGTHAATAELKQTLEGLAAHLFGSGIEVCLDACLQASTESPAPMRHCSLSRTASACPACHITCNGRMQRAPEKFSGGENYPRADVRGFTSCFMSHVPDLAGHARAVPLGGCVLPLHRALLRAGNLIQRRVAGGAGLRVRSLPRPNAS